MDTRTRTVRETLIAVAQRRETIFYADVARLADLHVRSTPFYELLDAISVHEHAAGRPLLTAVVVRTVDGMSGQGFFKLAARLRLHRGGYHSRANNARYWQRERDRVYAEWAGAG